MQQNEGRSQTLIDAIRMKNYEEVKSLLRHGINVNTVVCDGNYALHHAMQLQNVEIIALLLKYNAKVDVFNDRWERPYDLAIRLKDPAIIKMLLQHKVDVEIDDINYWLQKFSCDIKCLFYERIDIFSMDRFGYTALHRAVQCDDIQGMKILLSRGAYINIATDRELYTPLHLIKSVKSAQLLLQNGADHNLSDLAFCTPLSTIVIKEYSGPAGTITNKEQRGIIDLLIENGANCDEVIYYCRIALNFYHSWERMNGLKYLLKLMTLQENKYQYMRMRNLKFNNQTNLLSIFYKQCLNEVTHLQKTKVYKNTSYYDLAITNVKKLVKCTYNKRIVKSLKNTIKLKTIFPLYGKFFKNRFSSALRRNRLLDKANSSLNIAVPFINTNHIALHRILEFLENEDLENLIIAFP